MHPFGGRHLVVFFIARTRGCSLSPQDIKNTEQHKSNLQGTVAPDRSKNKPRIRKETKREKRYEKYIN